MQTNSIQINHSLAQSESQLTYFDKFNSVQTLQLGILDIGFITPGKTAMDVINETLLSASLADTLGYSRYWLSEHHESSFAWTSPEIMLPLIAERTKRIRIGTAGILLYFYSSLKIAEIFRLLEVLYPKRVDLGLAGGLAQDDINQELSYGFDLQQAIKDDLYGGKVDQLIDFLTNNFSSKHDFALEATPYIKTIPPMWLLGTGQRNMQIAAARGTAFSYSIYHTCSKCDPNTLVEYQNRFQPSMMLSEPKCNLAVGVICAETEAEARKQKALVEGIDKTTQVMVFGTSEQCKEQLLELQYQYQVPEIIVISAWHIFKQRKLSYQILAEALNLSLTD